MSDAISKTGGPCVCVHDLSQIPRLSESVQPKPHDGGVCVRSHTAETNNSAVAVAVVVVVVGSKMGSNYYPKGSQIPLWDLTLRWFDG